MDMITVGERVRLIDDVAPYPLGLFPVGTTGTVVEVDLNAAPTQPVACVKLDRHFEDLDEWDNVLQVFRVEDESSEVTTAVFAPVESEAA